MQTNKQLVTPPAAGQQPAKARWGLVARSGLALGVAMILLAGLGFVVSEGAAAPPLDNQASLPRLSLTQPTSASWTNFYPTGWVNTVPFAGGVTAGDPAGLAPSTAAYRTSIDGGVSWTAWTQAGLSVTSVTSSTVTIAVTMLTLPDSQSNNRVQFRIDTQLGVTQVSPAYTLQVDTVAPSSPLNMQSFPDAWTNVNAFRETWTNPADTSGIAGAYYRLDSEPQFSTDGIFVPNPGHIDGIQVPSEGTHSLLLWLIDQAGNVDHRTYRVDWQAFKYDVTPPTVGVTRQGPLGQNGWYTGTVTVAFAPADPLSGIQTWGWRLDGQPASTAPSTVVDDDALHTLVLAAEDRAGNLMQPATSTLPIDSGHPTISHTISLAPSASGWYTAPITVTMGLTDPVSGPGAITWQLDNGPQTIGSQVPLQQDGPHSLSAYGRDQAGNRSGTLSLSLPVDAHPPVTRLSLTPAVPGTSGFYSSTVAGAWSASDAVTQPVPGPGSGVLATRMKIDSGAWQAAEPFTLATTGIHRVDYMSQDVAGNREIVLTRVIPIDVTPPGAPIAPIIQPAAWSGVNLFTLSWQNPVDTSGIAGAIIFVGQGPPPAGSGTFYPETGQINGLTAPAEGNWPVWMALQDAAGNRGAFSNVGSLRYDNTPPQVQAQVTGPAGRAGWFIGPAQLTLAIADTGSGPAFIRYRLDGGAWQQSSAAQVTVPVTAAGKHVVDFLGQDQAGQVSGPFMQSVRIDGDAPVAPVAMTVTPETWTQTNTFTVTWRNPLDTSGISIAYFSFDPPTHPRDGQSVPAASQSATLEVPAEGVFDLHLWLEDAAGNGSTSQTGVLTDTLRFDATPPAIQLQFVPEPNTAGWFRSPVAVTLTVADPLSGPATTTWQLDGQPPVASGAFVVSGDGTHDLLVRSTDHAGNAGQKAETVRIDTRAPAARLFTLTKYSATPQLQIKWDGSDTLPGDDEEAESSGLAGFDVQVRQGAGSWQPWLSGTTQTQATYTGERGQALAFRMRSIDHAGNISPWMTAGGRNTVFIDPIENGAFGTLNWNGWNTADGLQMAIIQEQDLFPGLTVPAARLGSSLYQACAASGPNMLPTPQCGDTWSGVSQTVAVPRLDALADPTLEIWYRIRTYDQITTTSTIWNQLCPINPAPPFRLVDSFDVTAQTSGMPQPDVLLRDGNRLAQFPVPIEQRDLGWKLATIDMTPYAGRTVTLDFSSHNRLDNRFNTWTDVTGIRLRGSQRKVFLPFAPREVGAAPEPPLVCWPTGTGMAPATPLPAAATPSSADDTAGGSLR